MSDVDEGSKYHGPTPAGVGAEHWATAVLTTRDWPTAWRATDSAYRQALARRWLWAVQDTDEAHTVDLEALAARWSVLKECSGVLWEAFSGAYVDSFAELMEGNPPPQEWAHLAVTEKPSADTEIVTFVLHPARFQAGGLMGVVRFLMRYTGGVWRVLCAMGATPPEPGCPPIMG